MCVVGYLPGPQNACMLPSGCKSDVILFLKDHDTLDDFQLFCSYTIYLQSAQMHKKI